MTDFYAPNLGNKRLENCVFLQSADMLYWNRLILGINELTHPGERILLPDPVEAGAWQRAYAIYETLRDREVVEDPRAVERNRWFMEDQKAWQTYLDDREAILSGLRQDVFDEHTLFEHLGLQKGDLDNVLVQERSRDGEYRHPDWRRRADRLASALRSWHLLSGEEKKVLRQMRVTRKLEAMQEARK